MILIKWFILLVVIINLKPSRRFKQSILQAKLPNVYVNFVSLLDILTFFPKSLYAYIYLLLIKVSVVLSHRSLNSIGLNLEVQRVLRAFFHMSN